MSGEYTIHFHNGKRREKTDVFGSTKKHAISNWEKIKKPNETFVKIKVKS